MAEVSKEQVELAEKLASLVTKMAETNARIEKSYKSQVDTMAKLAGVVEKIASENGGSNLNELSKAIKGLASSTDDLDKKSSSAFGGMTERILKATKPLGPLGKNISVTSAAVSGLGQGLKNIVNVSSGILGFMGSLVTSLIQVGASIIAIPFKIFNGLIDIADKANLSFMELRQAMENLRKEFGRFTGPTSSAITGLTKNMVGFKDTGLSTWRVFGTLAERLALLQGLAVGMGATFQVLRKEFVANGGALLAYQKGLGLNEEQMKAVAQRSITMGDTLADTFKQSTKYANDLGKAFGIDSKLLSRDMAKAMADVGHFSNLAQKEIATASVYARKLGVELDKITNTLNAFETFDTASENVAKLSQSFGVTVDAFQLMESQNPAEQIDILRKAFQDAGQDASTFNRQQLKLLASTTGLDEITAQQVFSQKNMGVSYDQIKQKAGETEKKTLTQAQAMKVLADNIERLVKQLGGPGGGIFDHFVRGLFGGIQQSAPFLKSIMNIQRALRMAEYAGVQVGRAFVDAFPGVKTFLEGIQQVFDPKRFRAFTSDVVEIFKKFFKDLETGDASFSKLFDELQKKFFDYFSASTPGGSKILEGFKTFFKTMAGVFAQGIEWASVKVSKAISDLAEFIQNPDAFLAKAKAQGTAGTSWVVNALEPVGKALVKAAPLLFEALKKLMGVVWSKMVTYFKSPEFQALIQPLYPIIAGMLFGPALTRAIAAQIGSSLFNVAKNAFSKNIIEKELGTKMGTKVAEGLTKLTGRAVSAASIGIGAGIAAAAIGVSNGVEAYAGKITGALSQAEKEVGAGSAGIIDMLTLGLLPDNWSQFIAQKIAEGMSFMREMFNSLVGGLGNDLFRIIADTFKVFEGLGDMLKGIFTLNPDLIIDGFVKMIRSAAALMIDSLLALPTKIAIGAASLAAQIGSALIALIGAGIERVGKWLGIDAVANFGKDIKNFWNGAKNSVSETFSGIGNTVSGFFGRISDSVRGSSSEAAKEAAKGAEKVANAPKKVFEDTKKSFSADPSGFMHVAESVVDSAKSVNEKLASINVNEINEAFKKLSEIKAPGLDENSAKTLSNYSQLFSSFGGFLGSIGSVSREITKKSVASTTSAVKEMVTAANAINDALADGNLNKIDVSTKLNKVATAVGLGSQGTYSIKNKDVVVQLNLTVYMDVAEAERIMVTNQKSIIRDRLNLIGENVPALQKQTNYPIKPGAAPSLVTGGK